MYVKLIILGLSGLIISQKTQAETTCSSAFRVPPLSWISQKTGEAARYLKKSPQRKKIEAILLEEFGTPTPMTKEPLRTQDSEIRIIHQGLGSRKPVQVVLKDLRTQKEEVLLSSSKFKDSPDNTLITQQSRRNNSVIPAEISLSPKRDYLIILMAAKGNIDIGTLVIFRLADRKILAEIPEVRLDEPVWLTPSNFAYRKRGQKGLFLVHIENDQISIKAVNASAAGGADQIWYYQIAPIPNSKQLLYKFRSPFGVKPFELALDPVLEVLGTIPRTKDVLWLRTTGKNGFHEVLKIDVQSQKVWTIVPEDHFVIDSVKVKKDHVIVDKFLGSERKTEIWNHEGSRMETILAPDCCKMTVKEYNPENRKAIIALSSPARKNILWVYDLNLKKWSIPQSDKSLLDGDPKTVMMTNKNVEYITEYSTYQSKDGTEIPIRITYRKGLVRDGNAPALMQGYGGFGLNYYFHPSFDRMVFEFIKAGGVHVAPALRGSTVFGKRWHDEGRALKKQNVIDDFISAAEWVRDQKITRPQRLAISGGSHGGLVVGAAVTQRPDLFGLAFPQFGPLAFHDKPNLDPLTFTSQVHEYGNLVKNAEAAEKARLLSPELNLSPREYPRVVVVTGRQDSRVNPEHSYRFVEKLVENQKGKEPIFFYGYNNSGHHMNSPLKQGYIGWRTTSNFWTFIFDFMKMEIKEE